MRHKCISLLNFFLTLINHCALWTHSLQLLKTKSCFLLVVSIAVKKKKWPLRNLWGKHLIGVAGLQFQRSIIITARKMLAYRQICCYTSRQQEGHCETEMSLSKRDFKVQLYNDTLPPKKQYLPMCHILWGTFSFKPPNGVYAFYSKKKCMLFSPLE